MGGRATAVSFSSCITGCERGSRWEACFFLKGDRMGLNSLISACGRALRWQLALQLPADDVVALNARLTCAQKSSRWRLALQLLSPSEIACNACLGACVGRWRQASQLFIVMKERFGGVAPVFTLFLVVVLDFWKPFWPVVHPFTWYWP